MKSIKPKKLFARQKKSATELGERANEQVDRHVVGRLQSLAHSWRFVLSWLVLATLLVWVLAVQTRDLSRYYTRTAAIDGGTYVEGILGPVTNFNPIFGSTSADQSVSRLLFSSILKVDQNNQLVNDLAESIEADERAATFTVVLKDDVFWHDGEELDTADVAFTLQSIQDPDARSPLFRSWEGVDYDVIDEQTIEFNLPGSFSPFPTLLTFGILPQHILGDLSPNQLRGAQFNSTNPIGSGPFEFRRIVNEEGTAESDRELQIQLSAYDSYHLGEPRLEGFNFWVVPDEDRLKELFEDGQLSGSGDIDVSSAQLDNLKAQEQTFSLTSAAFLFFKNTNPQLEDVELRRALAQSIDVADVIGALGEPAIRINSPLLPEQLGYREDIQQVGFDLAAAESALDDLGWVVGEDGLRRNDGETLDLQITSQADTVFEPIAIRIVDQLANVGVNASLDLRSRDGYIENVLQNHVYSDIVIHAINIGIDPDVYSFWHSTQFDPNSTVRLNLAEYSSELADEGLDGGRSRVEEDIRSDKYQIFLEAWADEVPAIGLYRNSYDYYTLSGVEGPSGNLLSTPLDRYRDVTEWTVLTGKEDVLSSPQ